MNGLRKEFLNSVGQQFLLYKQNKQSTIASHLNSFNIKKTMTHDFGNPNPGLGQAQKCGGVKPANGIPTSVLLYRLAPLF